MGLSWPLFSFIHNQFSNTIQYYFIIICRLFMLSYPHRWWFPQLWNSPISRARTHHSTREHRRMESIVNILLCLSIIYSVSISNWSKISFLKWNETEQNWREIKKLSSQNYLNSMVKFHFRFLMKFVTNFGHFSLTKVNEMKPSCILCSKRTFFYPLYNLKKCFMVTSKHFSRIRRIP